MYWTIVPAASLPIDNGPEEDIGFDDGTFGFAAHMRDPIKTQVEAQNVPNLILHIVCVAPRSSRRINPSWHVEYLATTIHINYGGITAERAFLRRYRTSDIRVPGSERTVPRRLSVHVMIHYGGT